MQYRSFWQQEYKLHPFSEMKGNCKCDVAIIGGGMCGLLTAWELIERGVSGDRIVILDAERVGFGTSALSTAKLTVQHGLIYSALMKNYGADLASQYAAANLRGVENALALAERLHVPHIQRLPSHIYACTEKQSQALEEEKKASDALGLNTDMVPDAELPFPVHAALRMNGQAAIQPVAYMKAVAEALIQKGCVIYEHTKALYPQKDAVVTDKGKVFAKAMVISTRFPFADKRGLYYLKLRQQRSYLLMVDRAQKMNGCYVGCSSDELSFRPYGSKLVVCGTLDPSGAPYHGYIDLIGRTVELYPDCQIISKWSAEDCITYDDIPYIGKYHGLPIESFVATGFNKWGMSTSFVAARIIADQITRGYADNQEVFSSDRTLVINRWKRVFIHSAEVAKDYLGGLKQIVKKKDTPVKYCTHMGCPLHWNEAEQVWDCTCHGSRFDEHGNVISGPAAEKLKETDD